MPATGSPYIRSYGTITGTKIIPPGADPLQDWDALPNYLEPPKEGLFGLPVWATALLVGGVAFGLYQAVTRR